MAIKVNGTTVIDDSRNLSNVGGLKTINSTSILGSGNISAGASTSHGGVGTYTTGYVKDTVSSPPSSGATRAGSTLYYREYFLYTNRGEPLSVSTNSSQAASSGLSGTWRNMAGNAQSNDNGDYVGTLWVRIS